ncbi:hypothetical protein K8R61_02050 [bacterium]|nr:hypothetical protein [bacterium]
MQIDAECCKKSLEELSSEEKLIEQTLKFVQLKKGHKMSLKTDLFLLRKKINQLV